MNDEEKIEERKNIEGKKVRSPSTNGEKRRSFFN